MEKSTLQEFHAAMYAKYPSISWETAQALYRIYYNIKEEEVVDNSETKSQPKKKSKK